MLSTYIKNKYIYIYVYIVYIYIECICIYIYIEFLYIHCKLYIYICKHLCVVKTSVLQEWVLGTSQKQSTTTDRRATTHPG